jgi:hypothetical protein
MTSDASDLNRNTAIIVVILSLFIAYCIFRTEDVRIKAEATQQQLDRLEYRIYGEVDVTR